MNLDELKAGYFYSNGAYGRTWGVRQLTAINVDPETSEKMVHYKGFAGTCRRKKGHCSPTEFARWARYQVVLVENDWKRVGDDESALTESQED